MKTPWLFMLACLLTMLSGAAVAQGYGRSPGFSIHDTDHDGYLSRAEFAALSEHCLAHRDARGRARCDPSRLLPFDMLDADRDGLVAEDEVIGAVAGRHRHGAGWRN